METIVSVGSVEPHWCDEVTALTFYGGKPSVSVGSAEPHWCDRFGEEFEFMGAVVSVGSAKPHWCDA